MFGQTEREYGQVPAVLGAVLAPGGIREDILTLNVLEAIELEQEAELAFQAFGGTERWRCHGADCARRKPSGEQNSSAPGVGVRALTVA